MGLEAACTGQIHVPYNIFIVRLFICLFICLFYIYLFICLFIYVSTEFKPASLCMMPTYASHSTFPSPPSTTYEFYYLIRSQSRWPCVLSDFHWEIWCKKKETVELPHVARLTQCAVAELKVMYRPAILRIPSAPRVGPTYCWIIEAAQSPL